LPTSSYTVSLHDALPICGRYEVDYVKCCHDFGTSMNTAVDNGQIEGGIVQGLGWVTMEEVVFDDQGKLRSNALSTYKVPDIYSRSEEHTSELQSRSDLVC